MSNVRLIAPPLTIGNNLALAGANPTGALNPCTVNGRFYSATPGSVLDVPAQDAAILAANGWQRLGFVGPTASRPSPLRTGSADNDGAGFYIDTDLSKPIFFDFAGRVWRDMAGAAV